MSSVPAPTPAEEEPLSLPTLPPLPTDLPKTPHDNEDPQAPAQEGGNVEEENQCAEIKAEVADPDANKQQTPETAAKNENESMELSEEKPSFLETLGDAHLVDTHLDGDPNVLEDLNAAYHADTQENGLDQSKENNQVKTEEPSTEDSEDVSNIDDTSPDEKVSTENSDETPKKRPPGRPRGSRSKKRAKPNDSVEDPSKDLSKIPKSARYLKKIQGHNPALATAYAELETAKQERDMVAKYVDEVQSEAITLEAKLKKVHERLEQAKIRLHTEEETVKRAADAVGNAELQVPCSWNTNYQKLVAYKEKHGHIKLPVRCPEDKELDSLCIWVAHQKARYKLYVHGEVKTKKPHRITALENLGIEWVVKGTMWQQKYDELLAFKEKHGHCMVPTRTSKEYKDLGIWVGVQRTEYKNLKDGKMTQLTPDRIELLEKAGFIWNVTDLKWQEMYEKLVAFRAQEGHCNIPERYPSDQPLSNWVVRQRKEYQLLCDENVNNEVDEKGRTRRMRMTQERLKLLNDIGFEW